MTKEERIVKLQIRRKKLVRLLIRSERIGASYDDKIDAIDKLIRKLNSE
jgi:hypothetical protein